VEVELSVADVEGDAGKAEGLDEEQAHEDGDGDQSHDGYGMSYIRG